MYKTHNTRMTSGLRIHIPIKESVRKEKGCYLFSLDHVLSLSRAFQGILDIYVRIFCGN